MKRISTNKMIKAIHDYRIVLELNVHRPTTQDSRDAIAQAQLESCEKDVREFIEEIESHTHPRVSGTDYETERFIEIGYYDWQFLKKRMVK